MDDDTKSLPLIGRLAPSPTGVLHLGNARSFLLAWLSIRSRQGTMLLRIEDIDSPRVVHEAEAGVVEDLTWMGLDWDGPVVRQSERIAAYEEAAARLMDRSAAFPCVCTRRDIEEAASAPHEDPHEQAVYPGTCRDLFTSLHDARSKTSLPAALRFRADVEEFPFDDLFCGPMSGFVGGDFVIQKKDGGPAYQLAVVVDDAAQGVTEVLRADDLLPSTPKQLLLYQALGLPAPAFAHVPLVVGPDGRRLAKRHGDTSLAYLRQRGVSPERLVGLLAWSCGFIDNPEPCKPSDLLTHFDLARLPGGPFVFENSMLGI